MALWLIFSFLSNFARTGKKAVPVATIKFSLNKFLIFLKFILFYFYVHTYACVHVRIHVSRKCYTRLALGDTVVLFECVSINASSAFCEWTAWTTLHWATETQNKHCWNAKEMVDVVKVDIYMHICTVHYFCFICKYSRGSRMLASFRIFSVLYLIIYNKTKP